MEIFIIVAIIIAVVYFKVIRPLEEKHDRKSAQQEFQRQYEDARNNERKQICSELKSGGFLQSCIETIQAYCIFFEKTDFDVLKGDVYVRVIVPDSAYNNITAITEVYNDDYRLRDLLNGALELYQLDPQSEYFKEAIAAGRGINEKIQVGSADMEQFLLEHGVPELLLSHGLSIKRLEEDRFRLTAKVYGGLKGIYGAYRHVNHDERLKIINDLLKEEFSNPKIHINVLPRTF